MKTGYRIRTLKACLSISRIKMAESLQYRMAWLAGASTPIFYGLIEITVYRVFYTYAERNDAGILAGLSLEQVVSYAWLTQILHFLRPTNIDAEIRDKITGGDVAVELCRPLDLYAHWFARSAAGRLSAFIWVGSACLLAGLLMPPDYRMSPPVSLPGLLCVLASIVATFLLCSAFGMLVCAMRLHVEWGEGPTYAIMLVGSLLSGGYLPLQLWPRFMQGFLLIQPFAGYLDIPARFYLGTLKPRDGLWAIGLQLLWTLVFIMLGRAIMAKRLKSMVVQGG